MIGEMSQAEFDQVLARAFGREPTADDQVVSLFREAGLCEESALKAARGFGAGLYFSFEDAALSQSWGFDNANCRRNREATPERIAEVAKRLPEHLRVEEQA